MLGHDWIQAHIPHQGRMCLLDRVLCWDDEQIVCAANSHMATDHPLQAEGRLGTAIAIEYAAQAMAVHGVLLSEHGHPLGVGYLASVRNVHLHGPQLDGHGDELSVRAVRLSGNDAVILYQFDVAANGRTLADGRASVVLKPMPS